MSRYVYAALLVLMSFRVPGYEPFQKLSTRIVYWPWPEKCLPYCEDEEVYRIEEVRSGGWCLPCDSGIMTPQYIVFRTSEIPFRWKIMDNALGYFMNKAPDDPMCYSDKDVTLLVTFIRASYLDTAEQ